MNFFDEAFFTTLFAQLQRFGLALLVLIIGWIVARLLKKAIERLLITIKVDKLAEAIKKIDMMSEVDVVPSVVISRIFYYIILLVVMATAADILAFELLTNQIELLINYLPNLISAMMIFIGGIILANLVKEILTTTMKSVGVASGQIIGSFIFYFLFIAIALSALSQAGIKTDFITSNLTVIIGGFVAAFAIGYGFASRNIMSNLLASLYSKRKFHLGDIIKIGNTKGQIIELDSTSLTLQTQDKRIVIPLNKLTTEEVEIFGPWVDNKLLEN